MTRVWREQEKRARERWRSVDDSELGPPFAAASESRRKLVRAQEQCRAVICIRDASVHCTLEQR